jgi:cytoskeletal protein RodZ
MGDYLRATRRRRRIGIERAAEETRIRADYLMRMESDEFDFLAPTYVRGFLKSYCRYLRADPAPLLEEFDRRFGLGRFDSQQIMALERHGQRARPPRKPLNSWAVAAMLAMSVIVLLAVVGIVSGGNGDGDPDRDGVAAPVEPSASPESTPDEQPEVAETPEDQVAAEEGITVVLTAADGDCWIYATEDGQEATPSGGQTIAQGETFELSADDKVFLRLGAPWAVELVVNGQNLGSPGGQDPIDLRFPDDLGSF